MYGHNKPEFIIVVQSWKKAKHIKIKSKYCPELLGDPQAPRPCNYEVSMRTASTLATLPCLRVIAQVSDNTHRLNVQYRGRSPPGHSEEAYGVCVG